jgi:hypothetical protein
MIGKLSNIKKSDINEYYLKGSMPAKITGYSLSGRNKLS